jgi:hypothetical protein
VAGEQDRDGKAACHQDHRDAEADNQPTRYPRGFLVGAAGSPHRSTLLNNPANPAQGAPRAATASWLHDVCEEKCNRDNGNRPTQSRISTGAVICSQSLVARFSQYERIGA